MIDFDFHAVERHKLNILDFSLRENGRVETASGATIPYSHVMQLVEVGDFGSAVTARHVEMIQGD